MKKQHVVIALFCLVVMMFSACYSAIPDMTAEEEARITQYMANLLLEYDTNYQSAYLKADEKAAALTKEEAVRQKAEQIRKEEEIIRKEKEEANKPDDIEVSEGNANADGDLESFNEYLGFDEIDISYLGKTFCMRYPESEEIVSFAMTPSEGNEFVILNFELNNTSGADYFIDMMGEGNYFVLRFNETEQKRALTTLLEEDLSIYSDTLSPGDKRKVVLVFEKPLDLELDSPELEVRSLARDIYKKIPLD